MKRTTFLIPVSLFIIILFIWNQTLTQAQTPFEWNSPTQLNLLNEETAATFPVIAADPYGRIHVAVAENYLDPERRDGIIFYTFWNGKSWQQPADILVSPEGSDAGVEKLEATDDGRLSLLWTSAAKGVFWSQTQSLSPDTAQAWKTTSIAPTGTGGDLVVQSAEEVAIAYIDNDRKVIFQRTMDGGQNWPVRSTIWSPPDRGLATFTLRLAVDEAGTYHAAWTETSAALDYNPSGVWYARSIDGGQSWQDYWHVPDEGSYINIGFDAEDNVHLLWNRNVGSKDGRYHAISHDGGQTWSESRWIFPGLSGRTGYPQMILDNTGQLHQLTSGRTQQYESEIYHSFWLDNWWSEPKRIGTRDLTDGEEGPIGSIMMGNQLHVVWRNNTVKDILHTMLEIAAQPEAPVPLPTRDDMVAHEEETAPESQVDANSDSAPEMETLESPKWSTSPPPNNRLPSPAVISGLPALFVVSGFIIWHRKRRH